MLARIESVACVGLESFLVEVEVDVADKGFPGFSIVGLPDKAVGEAKERVKTALVNSGFAFPQKKIIVNFPRLPKKGSAFDLPLRWILVANGDLEIEIEKYFFGSCLDGSLATQRNSLVALFAKKEKRKVFVPILSANEAAVVAGIEVMPVRNLKELIIHFLGDKNNSTENN